MSLGARQRIQGCVCLPADARPQAPTVPCCEKLHEGLELAGCDECLERLCQPFSATGLDRPALPPGVSCRRLLLGYLLGLHAERASALQASDTLSLREFLGSGLHESTPDHSPLCRPRQRMDLETHKQVFAWVLERLRAAGLAKGETVGVDATPLEAHAALHTLQRRNTQEGYGEFLERLAASAGLERRRRRQSCSSATAGARTSRWRTRSGSTRWIRTPGWPAGRTARRTGPPRPSPRWTWTAVRWWG